MANILKEIENAGRSTDNVVGHLTVGEIVIPVQLAEIPEVRKAIEEIFNAYEVSLDEFTVGNEANKINPETGYPEFFFNKIIKAVSNAVKGATKSVSDTVKKVVNHAKENAPHKVVGKVVSAITGGNKKSENKTSAPAPQPVATTNPALEKQYAKNEKAFDDAMAALDKKAEEDKQRADQEAKDKAIAAESERARGIAAENRSDVSKQLSQTLSTPIQQNAPTTSASYTPSGFSVAEGKKAVPTASGGAVPTTAGQPAPAAILAQKINEDSGGTNQAVNRFSFPNTTGLQFGGT